MRHSIPRAWANHQGQELEQLDTFHHPQPLISHICATAVLALFSDFHPLFTFYIPCPLLPTSSHPPFSHCFETKETCNCPYFPTCIAHHLINARPDAGHIGWSANLIIFTCSQWPIHNLRILTQLGWLDLPLIHICYFRSGHKWKPIDLGIRTRT